MSGFNLFAFPRGREDGDLSRHGLPLDRLDQAIRWAIDRGCDTVLISVADADPSMTASVTHHICNDPACPGGC